MNMVDDTRTVMFAALAGLLFTFAAGYLAGRYENKVIYRNSIGSPQNQGYIEQGQVRDYTHIDGKNIDDLVK